MFETIWNSKTTTIPGPQDEIKEGWGLPRSLEELIRSIPGPTFSVNQSPPRSHSIGEEEEIAGSKGNQVILVFFIGGVTFAEISALRFLASRSEGMYLFIFCSSIGG